MLKTSSIDRVIGALLQSKINDVGNNADVFAAHVWVYIKTIDDL